MASKDVEQAKDTGSEMKVVDQEEEERIAKENFVPSHGLTTAGPLRKMLPCGQRAPPPWPARHVASPWQP
jgi:hypothetical protein